MNTLTDAAEKQAHCIACDCVVYNPVGIALYAVRIVFALCFRFDCRTMHEQFYMLL